MSHTHWPNDQYPNGSPAPVCAQRTEAACNKLVAAWEDDRYVALAARSDVRYHRDRHSDANMYTQVVQVLNGARSDLTNKEGLPNMSAQAKRLRAAIARYRVVTGPDE